jgi:hypothetical protein
MWIGEDLGQLAEITSLALKSRIPMISPFSCSLRVVR